MSEVLIFNNPQFGAIRTAGTAENPLFCLSDVCKALNLSASHVKERLSDDVVSTDTIVDRIGRKQSVNFVNEDGLYDVILDSRKPEAKVFRKWVTSEVLPSIRKTGNYSVTTLPDFTNPAEAARAWAEQFELKQIEAKRTDEAEQQVLLLSAEVEQMQPKVSYYDKILASKATMTTTQIAQDYGMSAVRFNKILEEFKVQRKVNGQWILYAPFIGKGYVHSKPFDIRRSNGQQDVVMNTEWTQKGRLFLYDGLKNHGILPLIEQ
jgi:prophage antirepressor-like protein